MPDKKNPKNDNIFNSIAQKDSYFKNQKTVYDYKIDAKDSAKCTEKQISKNIGEPGSANLFKINVVTNHAAPLAP